MVGNTIMPVQRFSLDNSGSDEIDYGGYIKTTEDSIDVSTGPRGIKEEHIPGKQVKVY